MATDARSGEHHLIAYQVPVLAALGETMGLPCGRIIGGQQRRGRQRGRCRPDY
jgi:hypothetical protein